MSKTNQRPFYKQTTPWVVTTLLAVVGGGAYWFKDTSAVQAVLTAVAPSLANPPAAAAGKAGGAGGAAAGLGAGAGAGPGAGAAGAGGSAGASGGGRRFGSGAAQPVSVEAVRTQDVRVMVNAVGNFVASNTAIARVQVSAIVKTLHFKEGQQVQAGQLLASLDDRAYQVALQQAEGQLASALAQLDSAKLEAARYKDLYAKDAIAKQQWDNQEALVAQLSGTIKASQAARDAAKLQLSYTQVLAPIAGRVGLKALDLGNVAQPSDAGGVVSISQTRPIALVFAVPASHISAMSRSLKAGKPLEVQAFDRAGKLKLATGKVDSIDNTIDASTDSIKVKALFPNRDDALFPNQAVNVQLQLDTIEQAVVVPQAAVLRGAQGFYVYLLNADNTVSVRGVKVGETDAGATVVLSALQAGDTVVIDGVDRLREGAKVEVIATDPKKRVGANAPARGGNRGGAAGNTGNTGNAAAGAGAGTAAGARPTARPAGERPAADRPAGERPAGGPPADGAAPERPRWMDRLPPALVEKLKAMSPEERRAWFAENRDKLRQGAQQQGQ
jgi:membrane fusion protein, multidrug efflux system